MNILASIKTILFSTRIRTVITLFIVVIFISLICISIYFIMHGGKDMSYSQQVDLAAVNSKCPATSAPFSQFFIPIQNVTTITPLGHLDPPSHDFPVPHMYINLVTDSKGVSPKMELVAPTDIVVTDISIIAKVYNSQTKQTYYDYKLWFNACAGGIQGYLIHVYSLSPTLEAAFGPIDQAQIQKNVTGHESWGAGIDVTDTGYSKFMNVQIASGAMLGGVGGIAGMSTNIDFGLSDLRTNENIADPSIWSFAGDNHYVCSLSYFPPDIEKQLYAKLGDFNGQLVAKSSDECGEVYQDKIGTAQGVWLTKGTDVHNQTIWTLNPHVISFVENNINPSMEMIGFSSDVEQKLGFDPNQAYVFTPKSSSNVNTIFANVVPNGQVYCFQTVPQYSSTEKGITFILEMLDKNTIRMGTINSQTCGAGPWTFVKYMDFNR